MFSGRSSSGVTPEGDTDIYTLLLGSVGSVFLFRDFSLTGWIKPDIFYSSLCTNKMTMVAFSFYLKFITHSVTLWKEATYLICKVINAA